MRLVLDTNIWLDWLVFNDPAVEPLKTSRREGLVQIPINAACLGELARVFVYPKFELDAAKRNRLFTEVRNSTYRVDKALLSPIPRCADPDDQKFLELARDAQADWLITKDKALLHLARKRWGAAEFRIGTPDQWIAECQSFTPQ
ncbi:MAG TPA: putative toxin-antitoxin system toxin component, PIN family [Burkholderiales bacterium]|jgi:putative PIN family toxin of toxin-antitoxin system|nr:putative toxin-antitoxin system toxin component, PIN family [Burkholderiales bacterium]